MIRCSKCLLPSTLPGSDFDEFNECSWCRSKFPYYSPRGAAELKEILESNRSTSAPADCLVAVSGGKDSCYALVELQRDFGLRVEAYTYVHDGLTPHALRNAENVCETLKVKHQVVSLPNHVHLETFKTFFDVWVKSPTAVSAALTCVACKHYHLLGAELAAKRKIPMIVNAGCAIEHVPFSAVNMIDREHLKREGLLKGVLLLAKEMGLSTELCKGIMRHLSICFYGSLAYAATSRYLKLRYPSVKHIMFFDYCEWDPIDITEEVMNVGWEHPSDVADDWHSDCAFHVLKEYMFQKMFGVSYTDAFLSNQIRYGFISREAAWSKLVDGKRYFAGKLLDALDFAELGHLSRQVDASCFDITVVD